MAYRPRREGYLLIDHRDSPGVPDELVQAARRAGKDVPAAGADCLYESATVTCLHCNAVVVLNPKRTRPRHYCPACDGYVCDACDARRAVQGCRPFEKLLDYVQDRAGPDGLPDLAPLWSRVSVPASDVPGDPA